MGVPHLKTRSEQKAEWLNAERAVRPLSESEWQELARAEHAIYCRNWRQSKLDQDKRENAELLKKVLREAAQDEWR